MALVGALKDLLRPLSVLVGLAGVKLAVARRHEVWLAPLVGAVTGLVTGATGVFVLPAVLFTVAASLLVSLTVVPFLASRLPVRPGEPNALGRFLSTPLITRLTPQDPDGDLVLAHLLRVAAEWQGRLTGRTVLMETGLAAALVWQSMQSRVIPYVVEVDALNTRGRARGEVVESVLGF